MFRILNLKNIFIIFFFSPVFACAKTGEEAMGGFAGLVDAFSSTVVKSVGTLFLTLAVVAFFWGTLQFIWAKSNGGDGDKIKVGKDFMAWGLLALFVMFSVWGIIEFFGGALQIRTGGNIDIPQIQFTP